MVFGARAPTSLYEGCKLYVFGGTPNTAVGTTALPGHAAEFHFLSRRERGGRGEGPDERPRIARMDTDGNRDKKVFAFPRVIWECNVVRDCVL